MSIEIEGYDKLMRELDSFNKRQIPYALSVTLNNVAEIAMKNVSEHIGKTFNVTSRWNKVGGKYGIKKKRATKKNLEVEIFIPKSNTWIEDHEDGDERYNQLVPTKEFKKLYKLKTNRAIKAKAKKLLSDKSKYRIFEGVIKGNRYIIQRDKGKQEGKRKLKSKKTGRLLKPKKILKRSIKSLFLIKPRIKEKERLEFYETINKTFIRNINKEFGKAFDYAMRTSR